MGIQKGVGKGTGCNFDANLVWTTSACTEEEAKASAAPVPAAAPAPAAEDAPAPAPESAQQTVAQQGAPDLQQVHGGRIRESGFETRHGHAVKDNNAACNHDATTSKGNAHRFYYTSNPMECAATCNSCGECKAFVDNHKKSPKYCVFKMSSETYAKQDNEKDAYVRSSTTDLELEDAANELASIVEA